MKSKSSPPSKDDMAGKSRKAMNQKPRQDNMFGFASLKTWLTLIFEKDSVEGKYLGKMFIILLVSFFSAPLRIYERFRYGKIVAAQKLPEDPVFILGHHRSGTTLLHTLFSLDPRYCFVSTFQAVAQGFAISGNGKIKAKLEEGLPETRSMDKMEAGLDLPQEEEIALSIISPYSFNHHISFPKRTLRYLKEYMLLEGISSRKLTARKKAYLNVLKKATYLGGGRPLVLKSPGNTAQIPFLLELFPNAKFIYIGRNPYDVFPSVINLAISLGDTHLLHDVKYSEIKKNILTIYREMISKYLKDRSLIPNGNLLEIHFEELEKAPLESMKKIYKELHIPLSEAALKAWDEYFSGHRGYRKNKFSIERSDMERINKEWGFAFEAFGYPMKDLHIAYDNPDTVI